MSHADRYCLWVADGDRPTSDDEKSARFNEWLVGISKNYYEAIRKDMANRGMEIFEKACELEVFSPGDHAYFDCATPQALRPYIRDLENLQVLVSTQDESDKRRKTIQVTPKGWLIQHHLNSIA